MERYFIQDSRHKMSIPLTLFVFNSMKMFQCRYHLPSCLLPWVHYTDV